MNSSGNSTRSAPSAWPARARARASRVAGDVAERRVELGERDREYVETLVMAAALRFRGTPIAR